jgi:vitamin B12 transporter
MHRTWEGDANRSISPDTGQHSAPHGLHAAHIAQSLAGKRVWADLCWFISMKNRISRARLSAVAVAVLSTSAAQWAQAQGQLPDVVVTANRSEQLLTDALPHTTVLNRELIERSQSVDLPSLLAREAGFQYTQTGGRGQPSTLFLRGAASLQVLVLVDGVPLTKQDTSGAVSLEHIMLDQVERVEVVRGNVSAIYGSGAVGGVIQIFTKKGQGEPRAYVQAEVGARGSRKVSLGVSGQTGATHYSLGVGGYTTDAFSAQNPAQLLNVNPDDDGYKNRNYSVSVSHDWAQGHSLGLQSSARRGRTGFDGGASFADPTDVHKSVTALHSTTVYTHNRLTANWLSKLSYSEGKERATYDFITAFPFTARAATQTRTTQWVNEVALGKWLLTAGAEQQRQHLDSDDGFGTVFDASRKANAVFAGLSTTQGAHSAQMNVRRDRVQGLDAKTTSYLGYGYAITPQWKAMASASTAFNVPPLGYLYDPWSGNPALKPETARSHELGLQYAQGKHVMRATYFDTRTRDLLLYDFDTYTFNNIHDVKNKGLEVSYSGTVGSTDWRASLTLQDPVDQSTGNTLVRRAKTLAALGASHRWGAWTLGADWRYTAGRPDAVGRPDLGAYTLLDVTARYALSKELSVYGRIENLTDKVYQTAYGYNSARRGAFFGLSWQPKL